MKMRTITNEIVYCLQDKLEGQTEYGIADELKLNRDTVRRKINKLIKEEKGEIVGFRDKKQIRYFTLKNFIPYLLSNIFKTELYPNHKQTAIQLYNIFAKNKTNEELKQFLTKIGLTCSSTNKKELLKKLNEDDIFKIFSTIFQQ